MATELQSDENRLVRLVGQFSREALAIGIALAALLMSTVFAGLALIAADRANRAETLAAQHEAQIQSLTNQLRQDYTQYNTRTATLEAWLKARGVPIDNIYAGRQP